MDLFADFILQEKVIQNDVRSLSFLSSFPHPQVVPNLHEFLFYVEYNEDILKNVCNFWSPFTLKLQWKSLRARKLFGYTYSSKHLLFKISSNNLLIRVNKLHNFHFCLNYKVMMNYQLKTMN